ncbi:MAG: methylmalonyl-CoA mutase family protein, partial [Melioribacteraceae bacterium]
MSKNRLEEEKQKYRDKIGNTDTGNKYSTVSGEKIEPLYDPLSLDGERFFEDINYPGEYPFTRGIHPTGYRGKVWTMRQFSGFGSPEDTNKRFKYL